MIVKEIDLFKGVDSEVMNEIANISSEENYANGAVLFKRGQEADSLYILEEGSIRLVIENGGTVSYSLTDPGEVFGWSSMVESGQYTASAVCSKDSKVVKIERENLDKLFNIHPDVGFKVLKRLASVFSKRLFNAYRDLLSTKEQDRIPSYG